MAALAGQVRREASWKVWLEASRPRTLAASFSPVLVGTAFAIRHGASGSGHYALLFWLFALAIQVATNLHNDYADFLKGADTDERLGPKRAAQQGLLTANQLKRGTSVALLVALLLGLPLIRRGGWPFVFIVPSSALNAVLYTGGPWPLGSLGLGEFSTGYSGLGDLLVLLYFGFVAVCGTYYLQALALPAEILVAALPVGCGCKLRRAPPFFPAVPIGLEPCDPPGLLATAIIVPNNLRDRHTDARVGKRTLAVRLGADFARAEYAVLVLGAFAALWAWPLAFSGRFRGWTVLLPMGALPMAMRCVTAVRRRDGPELNALIGGTARLQLLFCLLFALGAVL